MGDSLLDPVMAAIDPSRIDVHRRERIYQAMWTLSFEDVIKRFELPEDIASRMREKYLDLEVPSTAALYSDVLPTLREMVKDRPRVKRFLLTKGYRGFQQRKIDSLGLEPFFDEIHIVAIDEPHEGKHGVLSSLFARYGWVPQSVIVVGDGREELEAGKALGAVTLQTLRPGVSTLNADYYCSNLHNILFLI